MKKISMLCIALLLSASALNAALPPLAQSVREIERILSSQDVIGKLHAKEMIEAVTLDTKTKAMGEGTFYLLETQESKVIVKINYLPTKRVGPIEFVVEVVEVQKKAL